MIIFSSHGCYKSTVIFYHDKYGAETGQSGATNIVKLPLAFVRGGWVNVGDLYESRMINVGYIGYDWSRTSYSSASAYGLRFYPMEVNPSYIYNQYHGRYFGFPLRCLYPGK